jgi:hypothetical protein
VFQGNHQVPQLQPQALMFPNLPNKPRTDKVEYELDYYCSQSEKYELTRGVVSAIAVVTNFEYFRADILFDKKTDEGFSINGIL